MIRVAQHPHGPRLYVAGRRIHHGTAGAAAAILAAAAHRPRIALTCLAIGATDWRDFPFRDCDNH